MNYGYIFGGVGVGLAWVSVGIFSGFAFGEALEKRNPHLATWLGGILFLGSVLFWPVGWGLLGLWQVLRLGWWVVRRLGRAIDRVFEFLGALGMSVGCRI